MSNKRSRDPLDDPKSGPSKNQLRGLAYVGQKPAFLQNALSALQGGTQRKQVQLGQDGRPAIPTRPDGEQEEEEQSEEDEWDLGRGDEAPTVVVLKEGKHLERDEVDRLRAEGKADGTDPLSASSNAEASKSKGSLSFSSSTGKANGKTGAGPSETWEDVVKRSKSEADKKQQEKEQKEFDAAKQKEKDVKKKKKDKKAAKKKIGMLSFEED